MNSLLNLVNKFYIKDKESLPDDIFKSIIKSTEEERWINTSSINYYNSNRGLRVDFHTFFGYLMIGSIPNSRYYIERERALVLLQVLQKNIEKYRLADLEKERLRLKESLEKEIELNENGTKKIKPPPVRF